MIGMVSVSAFISLSTGELVYAPGRLLAVAQIISALVAPLVLLYAQMEKKRHHKSRVASHHCLCFFYVMTVRHPPHP